MTITIKRSTAVLFIGLLGLLGGLALGQITQADAGPSATSSYVSPLEREIKKMNRTLASVDTKLGSMSTTVGQTYGVVSVVGELEKINDNTYGTCKAVEQIGCRP